MRFNPFPSILAVTAVLCLATPILAQESASPGIPATDTLRQTEEVVPVVFLPTTLPEAKRIQADLRATTSAAPVEAAQLESRNVQLMLVGGVALLTGAIIGGDAGTIVMIGGAGIGLYGLWRYLQEEY